MGAGEGFLSGLGRIYEGACCTRGTSFTALRDRAVFYRLMHTHSCLYHTNYYYQLVIVREYINLFVLHVSGNFILARW